MEFNASALRDARLKAGLSVNKLAKEAGISDATILYLESGKSASPRQKTISAISKALGVEWTVFFAKSTQVIENKGDAA